MRALPHVFFRPGKSTRSRWGEPDSVCTRTVVDARSGSHFIGPMSDEIIDLTQYLNRESKDEELSRGAFALWGADGERSRFALPLWRTIYLAQGERGSIVWRDSSGDDAPQAFVVLDLGQDPARLEVDKLRFRCRRTVSLLPCTTTELRASPSSSVPEGTESGTW